MTAPTEMRCAGAGEILGETEAGLVIGVDMLDDLESLSTFSLASSTVSTCININISVDTVKKCTDHFLCSMDPGNVLSIVVLRPWAGGVLSNLEQYYGVLHSLHHVTGQWNSFKTFQGESISHLTFSTRGW